MSELTKSWLDKKEKPFDSSMLRVGEMMEVLEFGPHNGQILLRAYGSLISLTDPNGTWSFESLHLCPAFTGRKLQPGESITLTQE